MPLLAECWQGFFALQYRSVIRLTRDITKTGRERLVPMSANLKAWLQPYAGKGLIMEGLGRSSQILQRSLRDAANASGIDWERNALRHSFASYFLALTEDPGKTSLACGHSVEVLQSTYKAIRMGETHHQGPAERYFEIMPKR